MRDMQALELTAASGNIQKPYPIPSPKPFHARTTLLDNPHCLVAYRDRSPWSWEGAIEQHEVGVA